MPAAIFHRHSTSKSRVWTPYSIPRKCSVLKQRFPLSSYNIQSGVYLLASTTSRIRCGFRLISSKTRSPWRWTTSHNCLNTNPLRATPITLSLRTKWLPDGTKWMFDEAGVNFLWVSPRRKTWSSRSCLNPAIRYRCCWPIYISAAESSKSFNSAVRWRRRSGEVNLHIWVGLKVCVFSDLCKNW